MALPRKRNRSVNEGELVTTNAVGQSALLFNPDAILNKNLFFFLSKGYDGVAPVFPSLERHWHFFDQLIVVRFLKRMTYVAYVSLLLVFPLKNRNLLFCHSNHPSSYNKHTVEEKPARKQQQKRPPSGVFTFCI